MPEYQQHTTIPRSVLEPHPFDRSWWPQVISLLTFGWVNPVLRVGRKRTLTPDDFFALPRDEHSRFCTHVLEHAWKQQRLRLGETFGTHALLLALLVAHKRALVWVGIAYFIEALLRIVQAYFLGKLVVAVGSASHDISDARAYLYATLLALSNFIQGVFHHLAFYGGSRIAHMLRTGMIGLIHTKAMRTTTRSQAKVTTGHIINLVSNDVERIMTSIPFVHYVWIAPVQIIVVSILAWEEVGPFVLAGISFYIFYIPFHIYLSKLFGRLRSQTASLTDQRVKVTNEVICGMRIIKMYAWEKPFHSVIQGLRRLEVTKVTASGSIKGLNLATFYCATVISGYFCFMPQAVERRQLNTQTVFYTLGLLEALRFVVGLKVPLSSQGISELLVALRRIQTFLLLPEISQAHQACISSVECRNGSHFSENSSTLSIDNTRAATHMTSKSQQSDSTNDFTEPVSPENLRLSDVSKRRIKPGEITCEHLSIDWGSGPVLVDLCMNIQSGSLVGVCGPIGSGKTSLLMGLLQEVSPIEGNVCVGGVVSYASQVPWIQNATARENVIMAADTGVDNKRYTSIINACALGPDLEQLSAGDNTEVGERGVTLSGGQKARLALARAAYRDADIYLLDDPLSAVDAHVGKHLFDKCICGILSNKTRILVTHQLQHLHRVDTLVLLDHGGHVLAVGSYEKVVSQHTTAFTHIVENTAGSPDSGGTNSERATGSIEEEINEVATEKAVMSINPHPKGIVENNGKLIEVEQRQEGAVTHETYRRYILAMASILCLLGLLLMQFVPEAAVIAVDIFLAKWADVSPNLQQQSSTIGIYTAIAFGAVGLVITRNVVTVNLQLTTTVRTVVHASRYLHEQMLQSILNAPIRFFDTQPTGRILNRFSKDLGFMDDMLPVTIVDFVQLSVSMMGAVVLACTVNPWVVLAIPPLLAFLLWLRSYYLSSSREVKRLEAGARSPVYSHFSTSLAGVIILRSHGMVPKTITTMHRLQDAHSTAFHMFLVFSRWIGFRLDLLTFFLLAATTFAAVAARDTLDPGLVGASLIYVLRLTGNFQWGVRQSAEIENHMTSVERVLEYSQLPSEDDTKHSNYDVDSSQLPAWPEHGSLTFSHVNLYYDIGLPNVLHDVSFVINAGEKIGVVGRTGAGKSSLISALFRLAHITGSIIIDGINISSVPRSFLRARIGVIPQDPVLFSGTMQYNLDPFDEYEDEALWAALEQVQLKPKVSSLPEGLSTPLHEHGANFSVGERQLVCLARAIL
eukprot:gene4350-6642_t